MRSSKSRGSLGCGPPNKECDVWDIPQHRLKTKQCIPEGLKGRGCSISIILIGPKRHSFTPANPIIS